MSAAFGPETAALLGTGLFFKGLGIARNMPSFKKVITRYIYLILGLTGRLGKCNPGTEYAVLIFHDFSHGIGSL